MNQQETNEIMEMAAYIQAMMQDYSEADLERIFATPDVGRAVRLLDAPGGEHKALVMAAIILCWQAGYQAAISNIAVNTKSPMQ